MQDDRVIHSCKVGRDDRGLPIFCESDVTDQGFIQNPIDCLAFIVSSFRKAVNAVFDSLSEFGHEVSFMFYQPANKMIIKWKSANNEFSMIPAMTASVRPSLHVKLMIP